MLLQDSWLANFGGFFLDLKQNISSVPIFWNDSFRSVAPIAYVEMVPKNVWFARVLLAEEFYFQKFPDSFLSYQRDHQLQVKLQIIQATSTDSFEKEFYGNHFFSQFNVSKKAGLHQKMNFNELRNLEFLKKSAS